MSGSIADNPYRASGVVAAAAAAGATLSASDPAITTNGTLGDEFINTTDGEIFVLTDATTDENVWVGQLGTTIQPPSWRGSRGVAGGGYNGSYLDTMDYYTITSTGDASDFGDLVSGGTEMFGTGASNGSRGVWFGGAAPTAINVTQYITFATPSNSTDFGDLAGDIALYGGGSAVGNGTLGIMFGGSTGPTYTDMIQYITIASLGDATDSGGNLLLGNSGAGALNDDTRAVVTGGNTLSTSYQDIMQYVTMASLGDSTDFGDLVAVNGSINACVSNGTRGIVGGGYTAPARVDVMQYITIQTLSNTSDFGNLTAARSNLSAASDEDRGCWAGGSEPGHSNIIDYVTITTTSDASDFGNLTIARSTVAGMSGDS